MNICLFSKEEVESGFNLKIKDDRANHILKILHKKEGDSFVAGVIDGMAGIATIQKIDQEFFYCSFEETSSGKPLNPLKMIIGFPRPIQLKRLLRDVAALGVCEVHLTGTELGEKSYMQSTLVEKGNAYKMLLDGTVQAGSTNVPKLFLHKTLKDCIAEIKSENAENVLLALDNVNPKISLKKSLGEAGLNFEYGSQDSNCAKTVVAAIGSERGWTDKERTLLEENGFIRCGMGERIMRTETAATVSASIILAQLGKI
ncbi:MAG: 16S rRNA (uracil(1498)-N(3))-methyltransferase [Treponema sp.]|nr:16S rRNA (uracil(1498)-N(3))-methyltransferase [Treponema sp.]